MKSIFRFILIRPLFSSFLGDEGFILIASGIDLRRVRFNTTHQDPLIPDQRAVVGLDFDFDDGNVYWSDIRSETIQRADVENGSDVEVIIKEDLDTPEGIAVDWINKKLYWTDAGMLRIEVADLNGGNRLSLVQSDLLKPRAIAVHPFSG